MEWLERFGVIMNFQAVISPSLLKVHLVDRDSENLSITLCQKTSVVGAFTGRLPAVKLCQSCVKKMFEMQGAEIVTAQLIGVREIT